MRANQVRQILNEKMEREIPYRRREIYHLVYLALEGKEGEPRMDTPDRIYLPRKWQHTINYLLKKEGVIHFNGNHYIREKSISLR